MGNCCATPQTLRISTSFDSRPHGEQQQQQQPPRKSGVATALANFFSAGALDARSSLEAGQQEQEGAKVKRDLRTWEVLPELGTDGVLDILHLLGSGGSGYTYLCRDVRSGELVAAKFISRPLSKAAITLMLQEVELQTGLGDGHLGVVSAKELILTPSHLALVMEYAPGGNMASKVAERWEGALQRSGFFFTELEARFFFRQFVDAVAYIHQRHVAHRDLKLDNTLLMDWSDTPRLKICDFGFAKRWNGDSSTMHSSIGTPVYMSPQLLAARYGKTGYDGCKSDVWAAGVVLFVLLFGCFPFDHDASKDANSDAAHQEVWLGSQKRSWRDVPSVSRLLDGLVISREAVDLLDRLFEKDEDKRPTIVDVQLHPWVVAPMQPEHEAAWAQMQQEQEEREQLLARHSHGQERARQEAVLAMIAVASQCKHCRRVPSLSSHSAKDLTPPRGPCGPAAAGEQAPARCQRRGKGAATAQGAAQQQQQQQQQQQPYLPHVAGKSDPSARTDLKVWGLEGGTQSLRDVTPPDFHRRVSVTAMPYVRAAGGASEAAAGPLLAAEGGLAVPVPLDREPAALHEALPPVSEDAAAAAPAAVVDEGGAAEPASAAAGAGVPGHMPGHPEEEEEAAAAAAAAGPGGGPGAAAPLPLQVGAAVPPVPGGDPHPANNHRATSDGSTASSSTDAHVSVGHNRPAAARPTGDSLSADAALATLPDGVWRLPLTRAAPLSAFRIPFAEYQVAAGALAKQLHQLGSSSNRLRAPNRSSWPMSHEYRSTV